MIFQPTAVAGAWRIEPERRGDDRGYFARTFCREEFKKQGLAFEPVQCSTSFNALRGTLRGLHYQAAPQAEAKLIRCTRGRIFDVAVDLRPNSPTFKKAAGEILSADNGLQVYIPKGCAHGFITLDEHSEILYMMDELYVPAAARGVRWNDPAFGIRWPEAPLVMNDRDKGWPDFI